MATDVYIDPITRDFVETDTGEWEETENAGTAVMIQIESEEGAWWGDGEAGSQNAAILRSELPTIEELQDSTRRSLLRLVAAGMISDLHVTIEEQDNAAATGALLIRWFDRSSSRPVDLVYSPLGGKPT